MVEYYLAVKKKRNEVLIRAATWINLENMLSDRSKDHIVYDSVSMKSMETQSRFLVARVGEGVMGVTASGHGVSICGDEMF